MTSPPRHAEIAGGGIAGLTAAVALAQRGWTVRLHERSPGLRAEGAGIYVWENGLRVLRAIGVFDAATAGCHQGWLRETRDDHNNVIATARWTDPGNRVFAMPRLQLLGALLSRAQAMGVEVVFGEPAVAATADGQIELQDGRRLRADLVVAADGVNSKLRDSLGLLRSRHRHADGAVRVMTPRTDEERTTEDGRKFIEYCAGPRRVLYTPCSATEVYLALVTLDRDRRGRAVPIDRELWTKAFPHLAHLIERIGARGRWDVFETIKLRAWSRGAVAVVGDAAHAQAPNLGQGGGCSLMNALSLAVAVDGRRDVSGALADWEAQERPLTDHTQRMTALYGQVAMLPPFARTRLLKWIGQSDWAIAQRSRTARHAPTGTIPPTDLPQADLPQADLPQADLPPTDLQATGNV